MLNFSPLQRRAHLVAWVVILVCVGFAPLAVTAQADDGTSPQNTDPGLASGLGEVAPGMWIFLDPATGRITDRPSPEQVAAIRAQVSKLVIESTVGLVGKTHPDGSKSLSLQGRFMNVSVITISPSGEQKMTCAETPEDTVKALLSAPRRIPTDLNGLETE
ncbi:MAG TPA: hypothetical protein VGS22_09565 [Thermoanaerobaculia bacterium]|jgi:hypothetical protein|nr:hypothetical protein [Thermoanaerobaculia bacterium]